MKFRIFLITMLLGLGILNASAQLLVKKNYQGRQEQEYYLKGAVTEQNGKVVFTHDFDVEGTSDKTIFYNLARWADVRFTPNISSGQWFDAQYFHNYAAASVLAADVDEGTMLCQGDEELVFTNKVLNRDAARLNYTLKLSITNGHVHVELSNIAYVYTFVEEAERVTAEQWISDSEAFDKKGRLLKAAARFRIRTIDLKDELFKEIEDAAKSIK